MVSRVDRTQQVTSGSTSWISRDESCMERVVQGGCYLPQGSGVKV